MITQLLSPRLVEALGFTLLHALWQGALFALALAVLLVALKRYSPQARYLVSVGLLAAFFLTSVATFGRLYANAQLNEPVTTAAVDATGSESLAAGPDADINQPPNVGKEASAKTVTPSISLAERFRDYYERHLPLLVTLWLLGVLVMQLRWLGQLAYVQRLRHYGNQVLPEGWHERLMELEGKLRIRKTVAYALSPRIDSPMVIGWLKPVVLLPKEMFERLADTEIYAILAHELAHVRRDDFAINLLQSILTNVFFFHPGVWWMSSRADEEREQACDDLAVQALGGALPYAKTLITMGSLSLKPTTAAQPALAMAFQGKSRRKQRGGGFAARIKRLFGTQSGTGSFKEGFATACILFGALIVAGFSSSQTAGDSTAGTSDSKYAAGFGESEDSRNQSPQGNDTLPAGEGSQPRYRWLDHDGNYYDSDQDWDITTANGPTVDARVDTRTDHPTTGRNGAYESHINASVVDALNATIRSGDHALFEVLLAEIKDVNVRDSEGYTPLAAAAHQNEVKMARLILARGANVEGRSREGWSALTEAADEGAFEVAQLLIESGANVNAINPQNGYTALIKAADNDRQKIARLLVENGADINRFGASRDNNRAWSAHPPLHGAANEGHTAIMRYLLDKGADIDARDGQGRTALMYAASEGQGDAVALLMSRRADATIRDDNGRGVSVVGDGHDELAKMLSLIDGSTKDSQPQTKSQLERQMKNEEQRIKNLEQRIEQEAQRMENYEQRMKQEERREEQRQVQITVPPGTPDAKRAQLVSDALYEALFEAVDDGDLLAMDAILQQRTIDIEHRNRNGYTLLMIAAREQQYAAAEMLIERGAKIGAKTTNGWTALHYTATKRSPEMTRLLIRKGADYRQAVPLSDNKVRDGKTVLGSEFRAATPLMIATEEESLDVVEVLLKAGANPNLGTHKMHWHLVNGKRVTEYDTDGWTPYLEAVNTGNAQLIALFERYGADRNTKTADGQTVASVRFRASAR